MSDTSREFTPGEQDLLEQVVRRLREERPDWSQLQLLSVAERAIASHTGPGLPDREWLRRKADYLLDQEEPEDTDPLERGEPAALAARVAAHVAALNQAIGDAYDSGLRVLVSAQEFRYATRQDPRPHLQAEVLALVEPAPTP